MASKGVPTRLRRAVIDRDGLRCVWCRFESDSVSDFDIDHLRPVSLGGTDALDNLAVACCACNRSRGNRPAELAPTWIRRSIHVRQSVSERFSDAMAQMAAARRTVRI